MGYRNLGPAVSQKPQAISPGGGQYAAEDHSFESIVFEQGNPPLDWEMNLMQDVLGPSGYRRNVSRLLPSSWLAGGFLESSGITGYTFLTPDPPGATTANQFMLAASDVLVNGWNIRFEFSGTSTAGFNLIQLPTPPGSGTRTDLVILEVWRALVSPAPSTGNKSATGQILRHGNAKAPDTVGNQNLADDIKDVAYNAESSRRVQIQYRYRVIPGITSLNATPDGMEDAAVIAHTVPYLFASTVDGASSGMSFARSLNDPGLWTAGTGSPADATALGTVDGFIYAVPICAVFRRNSLAFDRLFNINSGGLMASSMSGRPDGLYSDQIVQGDIKDMRKSTAFDMSELATKTFNQILDNTLATEHEVSSDGPGGTTFLARDDIGVSAHIGNPDGVRGHYSDRSITESVVVKVVNPGLIVQIDLSSIAAAWSASPFPVEALAASGTNIVGIGRARIVLASSELDLLNASSAPHVVSVVFLAAPGPAVDRIQLHMSATATGTAYIEVLIEYPAGLGVRRNAMAPNQVWTPPVANIATWVDPSILSSTSDTNRKSLSSTYWWMNTGHREVTARLKSTSQTFDTFWDGTFAPDAYAYVPETLLGPATLTYNSGGAPYTQSGTTDYEPYAGYTRIRLDSGHSPDAGTTIHVVYTALRPFPPVVAAPGDSYQVFYQTQAVQSVAVPSGSQTLQLVPRSVSPFVTVITSGSGSPDEAFPFSAPSAQIPVGTQPSASFPESALDTPSVISMQNYSGSNGIVQIPTLLPYVPDPAHTTLYSDAVDTSVDGDGRNFWARSDNVGTVYAPTAFAQNLVTAQCHKVAYPVLMELKSDFAGIGRRGTLVLVVFTHWFSYSAVNSIEMSSSASDSCAAVYRVRGNMMNGRRSI